ncbi:MAG: methyltransferase [Candidatus Aenigmatarchaeota archaeon]
MANDVYAPREDSFLLEKYVRKFSKGLVLDMGTGSGIQARAAAEKATFVIGVDISKDAIDYCKRNNASNKTMFIESDMFSFFEKNYLHMSKYSFKKIGKVEGGCVNKFDTIIFNPPYLPEDDAGGDATLVGGKQGYETIERFLKQAGKFLAEDGMILLIFSSFTGKEKVDAIIQRNGFGFEELEKAHVFFEDIYCYKITVE